MANKKRTALDNLLPPPAATPAVAAERKGNARPARLRRAPVVEFEPQPPVETTAGENKVELTEKTVDKHEIVKQMLYLPLPVAEQLRSLHFEEQRGQAKRIKMHDYFLEAIDLLFKNRGVKSIEDLIRGK